MTNLKLALKRYTERSQFHDHYLLELVIQAAREEERRCFPYCPYCGNQLKNPPTTK